MKVPTPFDTFDNDGSRVGQCRGGMRQGVRGGQNSRAYQNATGRRLVLSGPGRASRWDTRGGVSRLHIALDKERRHDSAGEVCLSVMAVEWEGMSRP